jgi:hypothetical protein
MKKNSKKTRKNNRTKAVKIYAKIQKNDAEVKIIAPNGEERYIKAYNSIFIENKKAPKKYEIEAFLIELSLNEDTKEFLIRNGTTETIKWGDKTFTRSSCKIEIELTGDIERKYKFDFIVELKERSLEEEKVGV